MLGLSVQGIEVPESERELLVRRARELASPAQAELARVDGSYVSFRVRGAECAVDARDVARVVGRLGAVVPVTRLPPTVAGVAFVEDAPFLVVDLFQRLGRARPIDALAHAPALLLRDPPGVAVAVEGPLDLVDAAKLLHTRLGEIAGELPLLGKLATGSYVVDGAWLQTWARALGAERG